LKIVVTTGTGSDYTFTRLLNIIDELCDCGVIDSNKLIVQSTDHFTAKNYKVIPMMPESDFVSHLQTADCVISHAGTGTVTKSLKMGKKVILFPRRAEFGEHMDDHQLDLCELFKGLGYVLVANDKSELINCLQHVNNFKPVEFISSNKRINQIIREFIEGNV